MDFLGVELCHEALDPFLIGRRRGGRVLQFLCRISLEPDSCVRQTESVFAKYGAKTLLVAKFVPGLTTAAPPLAGVFQMRPARFLFFDTIGSLVWLVVFLGLGYAFSDQAEAWLAAGSRLGGWFAAMIVSALAAYVVWYFPQWRKPWTVPAAVMLVEYLAVVVALVLIRRRRS